MTDDARIRRLIVLVTSACRPPPGAGRIALAIGFGLVGHTLFVAAIAAMMISMFLGLSAGRGTIAWPWGGLANGALIVQFPLAHSLLLTGKGSRWLGRLVPGAHGDTLATTTYAIIASLQLLALFLLWTPSGIVWWRAEGPLFCCICGLYASSWIFLLKAIFDAGAELQSGALGWMSLMADKRPVFPDMPTEGLFKAIRQPVYVAFALTLWTVPVWTPDQLSLAVSYTLYCALAPRLKERRFAARYGERFMRYRRQVPYAIPNVLGARSHQDAQ